MHDHQQLEQHCKNVDNARRLPNSTRFALTFAAVQLLVFIVAIYSKRSFICQGQGEKDSIFATKPVPQMLFHAAILLRRELCSRRRTQKWLPNPESSPASDELHPGGITDKQIAPHHALVQSFLSHVSTRRHTVCEKENEEQVYQQQQKSDTKTASHMHSLGKLASGLALVQQGQKICQDVEVQELHKIAWFCVPSGSRFHRAVKRYGRFSAQAGNDYDAKQRWSKFDPPRCVMMMLMGRRNWTINLSALDD